MKIKSLVAGVAVAASAFASQAASVWTLNSDKTEGLTYTLTGQESDSDTWAFTLDIAGINGVVDTVGGRTVLADLSLSRVSGFIDASLSGAVTKAGGMDASGCNSKGASFFCFDGVNKAVAGETMSLSFTIDAPTENFLTYVPHLKVDWIGSANNYDLVSSDMIAAVPEPETYALMLAGLGAVAFVARRRKARGD